MLVRDGEYVRVNRAVMLTIVEYSVVCFFRKRSKPFFKRSVPSRLVSETSLNVGEADVKVLAMEKVVRAFDDARLTQRETLERICRIG